MTTIDKKVGLGSTAEGYRVVVHVTYGVDTPNAERNPTVTSAHTHEPIPHPLVLAITGDLVDTSKRRSSPEFWVSGGQIVNWVPQITKPAGTLTVEDCKRFAVLWETWHLNTMRAACAHMDLSTVPADLPHHAVNRGEMDRYTWIRANLPCPVSEYKYGSAWLAEPVPTEVIEEIEALIKKANS